MHITAAHVRQLGILARLELTEEEIQALVNQLPKIVDYVSQLQRVETTAVPVTTAVQSNLRPDAVQEFSDRETILNQAPERDGQSWKVDAVFS